MDVPKNWSLLLLGETNSANSAAGLLSGRAGKGILLSLLFTLPSCLSSCERKITRDFCVYVYVLVNFLLTKV